MNQFVFPQNAHQHKKLAQNVAFGIFRLLSNIIVLILLVILAFIIKKGIGVLNLDFIPTFPSGGVKGGGIPPPIRGPPCL